MAWSPCPMATVEPGPETVAASLVWLLCQQVQWAWQG